MPLQEEFEIQGNFLFKYRGVIPVFILLLAIMAYLFHLQSLKPEQAKTNGELKMYLCLAITLLGWAIRIYTVGFSPRNTSGRNTQSQVADQLNTTGIYSLVRHPLYIGNFFMWLGFVLLAENLWFMLAFIFMYLAYYERIMYAEEQFLRRKFSTTYESWAFKTPAIFPNFRHYKRPLTSFDVKKVIRQEKTGLMLVFTLYYLFNHIGISFMENKLTLQFNAWFFFMISSVLCYATIKVLEKKKLI